MAGEIVKARKNLKQLREEIVEVSRELGGIREEVDRLNTQKVSLERESSDLRNTIQGLLKEIASRLEELRGLGVSIEDKHDVAGKLGVTLSNVEAKWKELEERFDSRTTALNLLNENIVKKEEAIAERQAVYDSLGEEIEIQLSQKAQAITLADKAEARMKSANEKRQQIMAAIHGAISRFKVFEKRIARFSKDTGYVVGYPRPEKLLDNNETHE
jgi:chromosome segregation ATPase